jgi:hypothetical protein
MKIHMVAMAAALATVLGAGSASAVSPAGSPADPNSVQNRQPGPSATTPTDPSAGSYPSARVPTAPTETDAPASDGESSGESGFDAPAGIPADPNSVENRQPGPSANTPTDPEAGSEPSARAPTAPIE